VTTPPIANLGLLHSLSNSSRSSSVFNFSLRSNSSFTNSFCLFFSANRSASFANCFVLRRCFALSFSSFVIVFCFFKASIFLRRSVALLARSLVIWANTLGPRLLFNILKNSFSFTFPSAFPPFSIASTSSISFPISSIDIFLPAASSKNCNSSASMSPELSVSYSENNARYANRTLGLKTSPNSSSIVWIIFLGVSFCWEDASSAVFHSSMPP